MIIDTYDAIVRKTGEKVRVVADDRLPPGVVYVFNPAEIAKRLGLWPYGGPVFDDAWKIDATPHPSNGTGPKGEPTP